MKPIPAGILLVALFFGASITPRSFAEESADALANQTLGPISETQDPSAADLAKKQGVAITPGGNETSAGELAEQQGLEKKSRIVTSPSQSVFSGGEGVDGSVYAVVSLPDGSAVIGGRFTSVNGQPRSNIARIKPDGTLDASYLAGEDDGVSGAVYALAIDASGNLLVGGYFTGAQGQPVQNFTRYLPNGTLDPAFVGSQNPNGAVFAVTVQPSGKILIGGQFSEVGDAPRRNVARFNADGTLDAPVNAANASTGSVRSLAVLADGSVVAAGTFEVAGQSARNILQATP